MRAALLFSALIAVTPAATAKKAGDLKFDYRYPPQARAIPALRAWLDAQAAAVRAAMTREMLADRSDAARDGRPATHFEADRTWKVVTDGPRFLSLSEERYDFTGGAHGNTSYAAMVYDKRTGARRTSISLFTSPGALSAAIRPAFCRQLDVERRRVRGETLDSTVPEFSRCIDPVGETVILGSSTRSRFDRIGVLIPPYEAGPYSDGSYEVTLPVTRAVLAAVRPKWRAYFAAATGAP